MEPEKWPWEGRLSLEKMYSGVWVDLLKGVWPAEKGESAEKVEQTEEEELVERA